MIAATSVLQIRASDIRQTQINWQSYLQWVLILTHNKLFSLNLVESK